MPAVAGTVCRQDARPGASARGGPSKTSLFLVTPSEAAAGSHSHNWENSEPRAEGGAVQDPYIIGDKLLSHPALTWGALQVEGFLGGVRLTSSRPPVKNHMPGDSWKQLGPGLCASPSHTRPLEQ